MNRKAAIAFVRAIARSLKAVGYYKSGHPVLSQLQRESHIRLREACEGEPSFTLACAGAKLLIGAQEEPIFDATAKALADHMFARSIVAIKFQSKLEASEIAKVMESLAESAERIRQAGGLTPLIQQKQATGIEIFEVDFQSLFAGKTTNVATDNELVDMALKELLQFKEAKDKTGSALNITMANVTSPESLGSLLDELIDKAAPSALAIPKSAFRNATGALAKGGGNRGTSVAASRNGADAASPRGTNSASAIVKGSRGGGTVSLGALAGISGDDLAELASQAYLSTCEKLQTSGAPASSLTEVARVLATAMTRLSPEARFGLLRQLSGGPGGSAASTGVASLSQQIDNKSVTNILSSVLASQGADPETVSAIGTVVRQLRPIESERRKLIDSLDEQLKSQGKPLDGVIWQQLQASVMAKNGLGMLEIPFRKNLTSLREWGVRRRNRTDNPARVQEAILSLDPTQQETRTARLLLELVGTTRDLNGAVASAIKELIEATPSLQNANAQVKQLMGVLLDRAEGAPTGSLAVRTAKELLSGTKGALRLLALLETACKPGNIITDALLQALDAPLRIDERRELAQATASLDESMLKALRSRVLEAGPAGMHQIVTLTIRGSPAMSGEFARQALRTKSVKSKESVLRALASAVTADSIALLATAAGVKGEDEAKKVMAVDSFDPGAQDNAFATLQLVAIESLGKTRSEVAVPPLEELLTRRRLMGNVKFDALRPAVAQALASNGTTAARKVLEVGRLSKHRAVQEACRRI